MRRRTRARWFTERELQAMAALPSHRAPRAAEILHPLPFHPPQSPPMPPAERALLDAVIDQPEDDGPRHALADWYEATGNLERARFIRAQLADELAEPNPAWAAVFEPWCARHLEWRRGFVEGMSLAGRAFIDLGAPLFQVTPLRAVRLVAVAPFMEELAAAAHLGLVEVLSLRGNFIAQAGVQALAASPHLYRLHTLDLSDNGLGWSCKRLFESLRQRGIEIIADVGWQRCAA